MPMYSASAPSSMAAVSAFRSSSRAGFSLSLAALYSRSFWLSASMSAAACWMFSCSHTGSTMSANSAAYSCAAVLRCSLYLAFSASMAACRSVLSSMSWMSAYSLSYCSSICAFTAASPSAAATMAFSYTVTSASALPLACALATSASSFWRMVSNPSTSAGTRLYLISIASRVSMSSCRRIWSASEK